MSNHPYFITWTKQVGAKKLEVSSSKGSFYIRNNGIWVADTIIVPSNATYYNDNAGRDVAISKSKAIVGSAGFVTFYEKINGFWVEKESFSNNGNFGDEVEIHNNYAIVGAPSDDENGNMLWNSILGTVGI